MAKSAAFGVLHLIIAFGVGWALTGSVAAAGAIMLVEPLVHVVVHHVFDRWWGPADAPPPWRRPASAAAALAGPAGAGPRT